MRKANDMSRLLRNPRALILLCSPIVLAGCQHPLAPFRAEWQPATLNQAVVEATPAEFVDDAMQFPALAMGTEACMLNTDAPVSPTPNDASSIAIAQPQQDCLTGQLADSLMNVFKTFTGR
jgi:hypothetical protein